MDLREASFTSSANEVKRHPWELARQQVVQNMLTRYLALRERKEQVVLDMGCGDAWLVHQISESFPHHQYVGVDIALEPGQIEQFQASGTQPLKLFTSMEQAAGHLGDKPVDVVLLLDVIEHIEDEVEFLKWLKTFPQITEQTAFVITVPAYQSLFCAHDHFLIHYRRYTRRSLKNALGRAGMRREQNGYFFSSLLPPRIIQVLMEKTGLHRPEPSGVGQWEGGPGTTRTVTGWLWTDYRVGAFFRRSGIHLPGLSTFSIAYPNEK